MDARKILMIPGPTEVSPDVLYEMSKPVFPHYGADWVRTYTDTTEKMKLIFQTEGDLFILVGSGSAALEACILSSISPGDKVLVISSGFFGDRLKEIVAADGGRVVPIDVQLGDSVKPEAVDEQLAENTDIRLVVAVHCETSTGAVNPVKELAQVSRKHGVPFMVDAISSLAGMNLEMDRWGIDLCVTASQKCLETPPGLGLIAVGERAWKRMESLPESRGWYLNLLNIRRYSEMWADWHVHGPVTMATSNLLALRAAAERILREGLEKRFRRHEQVAHAFRAGARALGLEPFVRDEIASATMTSLKTPPGIDDKELRGTIDREYGILIAGSVGEMRGKVVRVGHMGMTASSRYVLPTISALEMALARLGYPARSGSGEKAVFEKLSGLA